MVEAIEIFEIWKSKWSGDEYDPIEETKIGTYLRKYKAERELKRLKEIENANKGWYKVNLCIKSKLIRQEELKDYPRRPKNFKHFEDIQPSLDVCGSIRQLHSSQNLSAAYATISKKAKKHKHALLEEVYFITKGEGYLTLDKQKYPVEQGDCINIPKETPHFLEPAKDNLLEVLVITHPRFTEEDIILEE